MPARPRPSFPGFPRALVRFIGELEENNEKVWFDAHRSDYEEHYVEPAKAFVSAMGAALPKVGKELRAEPRINGSIMRIHRDVRFAKDKRPYKNGLLFRFSGGTGKLTEGSGFFLRIGPREVYMAAGRYAFGPAELKRYRESVLDAAKARRLRKAFDTVLAAGPYTVPEPRYKRVPRGFDADHPAADLLRHDSIGVRLAVPLPKALFGPDCVPFVIDRFLEMRPVYRWLVSVLGS